MKKSILVTGGAGFIGTHLVRALRSAGANVVVLDNLLPEVHHYRASFSQELCSQAECILGDIRDPHIWRTLGHEHGDIEAIVHLASLTSIGNSMCAVRDYDAVNSGGTAALLDALMGNDGSSSLFPALKHVVLASSRAVYGEGAYCCANCAPSILVFPSPRNTAQLIQHEWHFRCSSCGSSLEPVPTPETSPLQPASFYAATKAVQEHYMLALLKAVGIPISVLRFQNVFGPGQSLSNPYTGVIGVFYSNIVGGRSLNIYEDGNITRDFVYVSDVVDAICAALEHNISGTFNVGRGEFTRMSDVAQWLCDSLERQVPITCKGTFRVGDIRNNAADLKCVTAVLGYQPKVSVQQGLRKYVEWAREEIPLPMSAMVEAERRAFAFVERHATASAQNIL